MDVLTSGPPHLRGPDQPTTRIRPRVEPFDLAAVAVATALWAWTTWTLVRHGTVVTDDGTWYLDRARSVRAGDLRFDAVTTGTSSHYPPGYPALLAVLDAVPGVTATVGALVVDLVGWIAVALGFTRIVAAFDRTGPDLARGQRRLLVAVAMAALFGPVLVFSSASVLSEMVFFACWTWMLVLLLRGRVLTSWPAFGALVALAVVAALDRYLAVSLVLGVGVVLAVQGGWTRRAVARSVGFVVAALTPLLAWVAFVGGIDRDPVPGVLGVRDSVWDSLMAMGAEVLHVQSGRKGDVTTRGDLTFSWELAPALATVAVAVGAVVLLVAAVSFVQRVRARRSLDGTDPVVVLFVTTVAYVVPVLISRIRDGHIFLDRYWGLGGAFLLMVAVARPGSTRVERLLWWSVVAFGCWWTVHRQLWPLPV